MEGKILPGQGGYFTGFDFKTIQAKQLIETGE